MGSIRSIPRKVAFILQHRDLKMLAGRIRHRLYDTSTSIGMRRTLGVPFHPPEPAVPVTIRPITERDVPFLFDVNELGLNPHEREERMARLLLLRSSIPTCYVASTSDGTPCFAGWLFSPSENGRLQEYFHDGFPELRPDEALFEFAYTHPLFRGQRIMPFAMAKIAEQASGFGACSVLAFADRRNRSSIERCRLAGFEPYILKTERCRLFRRTIAFYPLPDAGRL